MVIMDTARGITVNTALVRNLPDSTGIPKLDAAIGKVKQLIEARRLVSVRIDTLNDQKKGAANADKRKHAEALAAGKKPPTTKESNVAQVEAEIEAARAEKDAFLDAIKIADKELDALLAANADAWIAGVDQEIANAWGRYLKQLEKVADEVAEVTRQRGMAQFLKQASRGRVKSFTPPQVVHTLSDDRNTTTWPELFSRLRAEAEWRSTPLPELSTGKLVAQRATKRGLEEVEIEPDAVRSGGSSLYTTADR